MSKAITSANPLCSLHIFPNAGHGLSYTTNPKRYEAIVFSFLSSLPMLKEHMRNNEYVQNVLKGNL
jgi:hypothetical protein